MCSSLFSILAGDGSTPCSKCQVSQRSPIVEFLRLTGFNHQVHGAECTHLESRRGRRKQHEKPLVLSLEDRLAKVESMIRCQNEKATSTSTDGIHHRRFGSDSTILAPFQAPQAIDLDSQGLNTGWHEAPGLGPVNAGNTVAAHSPTMSYTSNSVVPSYQSVSTPLTQDSTTTVARGTYGFSIGQRGDEGSIDRSGLDREQSALAPQIVRYQPYLGVYH